MRTYYRHVRTGDLGYLVNREGRDYIRMDRPGDVVERIFRVDDWLPETERRPLTPMAVAKVAFEADRALCVALGLHGDGGKVWANLPEMERVAWMQQGPPTRELSRLKLWRAVVGQLEELTQRA